MSQYIKVYCANNFHLDGTQPNALGMVKRGCKNGKMADSPFFPVKVEYLKQEFHP